ncbi:uncharacterized protein LOC114367761 [Glycine soja]|uniref:uncharacterized protein LOC114367761 n=1 Tax=Glycine soja TaxID=3848 RepID=UPI00103932E1|nr:uncharacterized protein LOC114367761 [Glycine soja]
MDEDQWAYYSAMSEEVDIDFQDEEDCGVNEAHVDCSDAFNTSQVFATREDVLKWVRMVAHENGFVAIHGKPVHGGEGWAVKLICGIHNHELAKTLVGHPYAGRLTDDEKNIVADMTKSNVKPRNILLTLKEHNNSNSTYKTNRYRLPLLDIVGVTPTGMTFSAGFAYLEGERVNNLVWALERFHIDKNVKAKCKSLIGQKNAWDYVMDSWGNLVDCLSEQEFPEHLQRVESAHWSLKRVLQNSVGDLCSVWDAINNMMTLQHTEIRASFETSAHVVGHVFKKTLYKRLLGMVSRTTLGLPCACELQRYDGGSIPLDVVHMYWRRLNFSDQGLCEAEVSIKEEIDRMHKRFNELDVCGKVTFKSKLREFAFPDETSMCPPPTKVKTKGAPKKVMKRSKRSTKRDPSYWEYVDAYHSVQNSNTSVRPSASSFEPLKPARMIPMLDQFPPFMHGFIEDVVDVKADGNCGYRSVSALLGMREECWAMMRNKLIKEFGKWSQDYIKIFGGTERYEQLRLSLHVEGLSKVSMDKWMDITDMRYVIASRYNVIHVSLSRQ